MTSCPDHHELVELIDGELSPERADAVVDHLIECAECRAMVGRNEAALGYALRGLSDTGRWADVPREVAQTESRVADGATLRAPRRRRPVAFVATAAAALVMAIYFAPEDRPVADDAYAARVDATADESGPTADLRSLLARAERLRDVPTAAATAHEDIASAALAAAEARVWTVGQSAANARIRDVVERFPDTHAAREARALLASAPDEESR